MAVNTDTHITNNSREVRTIRLENSRCRLDVTQRGDARYTPDFRGVAALSPAGRFILEERGEGPARRLELTVDGRGGVHAAYRVGGNTQGFHAAGEAWLPERRLLLYRRSGLAAAERAAESVGCGSRAVGPPFRAAGARAAHQRRSPVTLRPRRIAGSAGARTAGHAHVDVHAQEGAPLSTPRAR
jgi:hypothetical protein